MREAAYTSSGIAVGLVLQQSSMLRRLGCGNKWEREPVGRSAETHQTYKRTDLEGGEERIDAL